MKLRAFAILNVYLLVRGGGVGAAAAQPARELSVVPAARFTPLYSPAATNPAAVDAPAFRIDRLPVTNVTRTNDPRHPSCPGAGATVPPVSVSERTQSVAQPGEIRRVPCSLVAFAVLPHLSVGTLACRSPLSGGHRFCGDGRYQSDGSPSAL